MTDHSGTPLKGFLSLKVTEIDLIPATGFHNIVKRKEALLHGNELNQNQVKYPKELGLTIQGTVSDPLNGNPFSTNLLSIYTAGISGFDLYEIKDGILDHTLPDFYGSKIIQFEGFIPFQTTIPQVKLTGMSMNFPIQKELDALPERSPQIEKYIYYSKLRRKVNELFENSLPDNKELVSSLNSELNPDKTYWMKDYHTLKDVEEFISTFFFKTEIIESGGKKSVLLYNPDSKGKFMDRPWYLLNGYLTRDENLILKLPLKDVEKLELFYRTSTLSKQFNPLMIRSGVIAVSTKEKGIIKPDLDPQNNKEFAGYYYPNKFPSPSNQKNDKHQNPDFRPLVFWNPEIVTDESGKALVNFPASSAIGAFNIEVEGVTPNGEVVVGSYTFQVDF
ncbi:MAG: hypothetical protein M3421_12690 [Bacteroidota bacterium]|nr:hypothetical protein [Bacteroidota bacterium]